jgi:hypothetical protein
MNVLNTWLRIESVFWKGSLYPLAAYGARRYAGATHRFMSDDYRRTDAVLLPFLSCGSTFWLAHFSYHRARALRDQPNS